MIALFDGGIAQRQEADVSGTSQCGFESLCHYQTIFICRDSTTVVLGNHNPSVGSSSLSPDTKFQLEYGEVG